MIRLFRILISILFRYYFIIILKKSNNQIFICDIDNTIFNTWIEWKKSKDYSFVFSNTKPLTNSINFVKKNIKDNNKNLIFLTVRPLNQYLKTLTSIKKIFGNNNKVIILKNVDEKLWYYNYLLKNEKSFLVFDDLSYNHENGEVKYYDKLINFLKNNNVKHYDYSFILKLNEENS